MNVKLRKEKEKGVRALFSFSKYEYEAKRKKWAMTEKGVRALFSFSKYEYEAKRKKWAMTSLLKKAFDAASKLPTLEQNILARALLDEIESEKKWNKLFSE